MGSEQSAFPRLNLSHKYVGVCPLGLLLRIRDPLAIPRPDRPNVHLVGGGPRCQMFSLTQNFVEYINFINGRSLGFHDISQITAVRRPRWLLLGDGASVG